MIATDSELGHEPHHRQSNAAALFPTALNGVYRVRRLHFLEGCHISPLPKISSGVDAWRVSPALQIVCLVFFSNDSLAINHTRIPCGAFNDETL